MGVEARRIRYGSPGYELREVPRPAELDMSLDVTFADGTSVSIPHHSITVFKIPAHGTHTKTIDFPRNRMDDSVMKVSSYLHAVSLANEKGTRVERVELHGEELKWDGLLTSHKKQWQDDQYLNQALVLMGDEAGVSLDSIATENGDSAGDVFTKSINRLKLQSDIALDSVGTSKVTDELINIAHNGLSLNGDTYPFGKYPFDKLYSRVDEFMKSRLSGPRHSALSNAWRIFD